VEHVPTPLLVCSTFGGITILSVRTPSKPNGMPLKTCLVRRDLNAISNLKKDAIKKMTKVTTIFVLYILSILHPQTYLSVSILIYSYGRRRRSPRRVELHT